MLLRPWIILLLANHIVQAYDLQMSPNVEKDEQVIKEGSTLKLTCIEKIYYRSERNGTIKWTIPTLTKRKEVNNPNNYYITILEIILISIVFLSCITGIQKTSSRGNV